MTRTKLGLLGLCAVVFGLMALSAASAQAGFSWLILNVKGEAIEVKEEGGKVNLLASLEGEKDSEHIILLAKTLGTKLNFTCNNFTLVNVNLEPAGKLSEGKVRFTGCEAYKVAPLTEPLGCELHTTGTEPKTIETTLGKAELVLHEIKVGEKEVLLKIEPVVIGGPFVTILTNEKCVLPASNKVAGVLYLKDCELKATDHLVKHLVTQGALTSLIYGAHSVEHLETSLDGSAWIKLSGAHTGLTWGAMDV